MTTRDRLRKQPRFWLIESGSPDDYAHIRSSGLVEHPCGLPGIDCSKCGEVWMEPPQLVPYRLPSRLEREVADIGGPLPPEDHLDLQRRIRRQIRTRGQSSVNLAPGCTFAPTIWKRRDPPTLDWYTTGTSKLVSAKVRALLRSLAPKCVGFGRVEVCVGKPKHQSRRRIVEPEDEIETLQFGRLQRRAARYSELAVFSRSAPCPGLKLLRVCPLCGNRIMRYPRLPIRCVMRPGMWRGHPTFCYTPTSVIVVTDRIKSAFEEHGITGCTFSPA